ncbi:actin cytoskeleton-regulatory complex protein pan-1-like [Prionailurus viverrinus]|uniref:actin cytoskeleton-regulatory complex protein pan-1-like n=1 Tax=Prionailurus viverrinus TaxID=61388 RepID=UPI001FF6D620|nr:actin cytoskeleton-regulatory complex protein pan-1-like [Prionailurus viverrinus]
MPGAACGQPAKRRVRVPSDAVSSCPPSSPVGRCERGEQRERCEDARRWNNEFIAACHPAMEVPAASFFPRCTPVRSRLEDLATPSARPPARGFRLPQRPLAPRPPRRPAAAPVPGCLPSPGPRPLRCGTLVGLGLRVTKFSQPPAEGPGGRRASGASWRVAAPRVLRCPRQGRPPPGNSAPLCASPPTPPPPFSARRSSAPAICHFIPGDWNFLRSALRRQGGETFSAGQWEVTVEIYPGDHLRPLPRGYPVMTYIHHTYNTITLGGPPASYHPCLLRARHVATYCQLPASVPEGFLLVPELLFCPLKIRNAALRPRVFGSTPALTTHL